MGRAAKMFRLTLIVGFLFCITAQVIDLKDDELEAEIPKQQKVLSRSRRNPKQKIPTKITFKTDIGITPNLYSKFANKAEVDNYVGNLIKQANKLFSDADYLLHTTVTIQVRHIKIVNHNLPTRVTEDSMTYFKKNNYHLGVLGLSEKANSGHGLAWMNSACRFSKDFYPQANIANFAIKTDPGVNFEAALLVHEIGHVLGMVHNDEGGCSGLVENGLMNPSVSPSSHKWLSCNGKQLRKHYNKEGYTCM